MPFYETIVESPDGGKLDYQVPNVQLIKRAKYQWVPTNSGKAKSKQAQCCFEYLEELPETDKLRKITEDEFNNYNKFEIKVDKTTIKSNGSEKSTITVTGPKVNDNDVEIKIVYPDKTDEIVSIGTDSKKKGTKQVHANVKGKIYVGIHSKVYHNVEGLGSVEIDAS